MAAPPETGFGVGAILPDLLLHNQGDFHWPILAV
jgi:hypothetical protein